jgi:hypothetical protein
MNDRSATQMEELAEHVAEFRIHQGSVKDACRTLSDAASLLRDPDLAMYCEEIGVPPEYLDAMRLIGDNDAGLEDENGKVPGWVLELCMLMIATADELDQIRRVAIAGENGSWRAAVPMLIELRRIRDLNSGEQDKLS